MFLRFAIDEVPVKKKAAIGVRGIKLSTTDELTKIYYLRFGEEKVIEYQDKKMDLSKLRLGKRDSKGTKVRV